MESGLATLDEIKQIDADVKKEVDAATAAAKADSEIAVTELTTDVYSANQGGDIRGAAPDTWLKHTSLNKAVNL